MLAAHQLLCVVVPHGLVLQGRSTKPLIISLSWALDLTSVPETLESRRGSELCAQHNHWPRYPSNHVIRIKIVTRIICPLTAPFQARCSRNWATHGPTHLAGHHMQVRQDCDRSAHGPDNKSRYLLTFQHRPRRFRAPTPGAAQPAHCSANELPRQPRTLRV